MKRLGGMNRFVGGKIVRQDQYYTLQLTYTKSLTKEVNLEAGTLNSCRDPRLHDVGAVLSEEGLTVVVQSPFEEQFVIQFSRKALQNQAKFISNFFKEFSGRVRSFALDGSTCPQDLKPLRKRMVQKLRALKAVGATEFRYVQCHKTLGDRYPKSAQYHSPQHLKVWERKLVAEFEDTIIMHDQTGRVMSVTPRSDGFYTQTGCRVSDQIVAIHTLHTSLSLKDMWHAATFIQGGRNRTVRKGLNRHREMLQQKTQEKQSNSTTKTRKRTAHDNSPYCSSLGVTRSNSTKIQKRADRDNSPHCSGLGRTQKNLNLAEWKRYNARLQAHPLIQFRAKLKKQYKLELEDTRLRKPFTPDLKYIKICIDLEKRLKRLAQDKLNKMLINTHDEWS
jgi:hypothetical protein